MIMGDMNANIQEDDNHSINHTFGKQLVDFCKSQNLIISDQCILGISTYTFVNPVNASTSWLDHAICTAAMHK